MEPKVRFLEKLYSAAKNPANSDRLYFHPNGKHLCVSKIPTLEFPKLATLTRNLNMYKILVDKEAEPIAERSLYAHPFIPLGNVDLETFKSIKRRPVKKHVRMSSGKYKKKQEVYDSEEEDEEEDLVVEEEESEAEDKKVSSEEEEEESRGQKKESKPTLATVAAAAAASSTVQSSDLYAFQRQVVHSPPPLSCWEEPSQFLHFIDEDETDKEILKFMEDGGFLSPSPQNHPLTPIFEQREN